MLSAVKMGRLGALVAGTAEPKPNELIELADHLLTRGRQRRVQTDYLTTNQEQRRRKREWSLGDDAVSVSLNPAPGCRLHQLG